MGSEDGKLIEIDNGLLPGAGQNGKKSFEARQASDKRARFIVEPTRHGKYAEFRFATLGAVGERTPG